jgi:hypothetical protein
MPTYMLIYTGPPTPPDATHAGWREWFQSLGPKLIDTGSPMRDGFAFRPDGTTGDPARHLNGFSLVQAEDRDELTGLLRTHPLAGSEWTIEVFALPAKER